MSPFRRDLFINRVKEIGVKRKKFVATARFVGPTHRTSNRSGRSSAPEFDVPNPVQSLGTGVPRETFWKEIEAAAVDLNSRKMNSDVSMISAPVEEIVPEYENRNISEDFRQRINFLRSSVYTLHNRAMRLGYVDIENLCDMVGNLIIDIREHSVPPNMRHLKVMPKLMQGFQTALEMLSKITSSA